MAVHVSPGHMELIRTISSFLGEFAAEDKLEHANEDGVDIIYNKKTAGLVRFRFVTFDDIELNLDVQLQDVNREYLENMLNDILVQLEEHRSQRQAGGVAGAIHEMSQVTH